MQRCTSGRRPYAFSKSRKALQVATVLYADPDGSTDMVDKYPWWFSAQVYKAYLRCAGKIIQTREAWSRPTTAIA